MIRSGACARAGSGEPVFAARTRPRRETAGPFGGPLDTSLRARMERGFGAEVPMCVGDACPTWVAAAIGAHKFRSAAEEVGIELLKAAARGMLSGLGEASEP